jgi:cyclopropane-fatty-acyl-phospholipid synthase
MSTVQVSKPATDRTSESRALQRVTDLLRDLFPAPRNYSIHLQSRTLLPATTAEQFSIVINSPDALRRMFRPPLEMAIGEAYLRNDFDIEGDIFAVYSAMNGLISLSPRTAMTLFRLRQALQALPDERNSGVQERSAAQIGGPENTRAYDRAAIQYHYDVSNDFYRLWLDGRMVYSCAYFPTGAEDLDTAQERKLEHICRKLRLKPGETLLDIGCGWGGLVIYAAQHYGVKALGVTLSQGQHDLAQQRIAAAGLSDQVTVKLLDYRDLGDMKFDKIVSVGMFEHVTYRHLPEYFNHAYRYLKEGGLFLNHGISMIPSWRNYAKRGPVQQVIDSRVLGMGQFIKRYVFPNGELVPISQANSVAEHAGFELRDVENLREHYALTLRQWVKRLQARHDEAVALTNETVYRIWRLYMAVSAFLFENGAISVNQSLFVKPIGGRSGMPMSRADVYR